MSWKWEMRLRIVRKVIAYLIGGEAIFPPILLAEREPEAKDTNFSEGDFWVCKKSNPYKVFKRGISEWIFIGNFYPENNVEKNG